MKTKRGLKIVSFMMVLCLLLCGIYTDVANAKDGTIITISKAGQVVDTFNGVDSVYRPGSGDGSNATYGCFAYVVKYYQAIYGLTVYNLFHKQTPLTYGDSFVVVKNPQPGDICAEIKASSNHWSIVKSVNGTTVTVIDQNNKWVVNGVTQAYKDYTYNFSEVTFYRLASVAKSGTTTTAAATTTETSTADATTQAQAGVTGMVGSSVIAVVKGKKLKLTANHIAQLATDAAVSWKSSKKSVATVSKAGNVKGKKKGTSKITATLASGNKVTVKVKVIIPATKLKLVSEDVTLLQNTSWQITSTMKPKGCNDIKYYSSSDPSVASVDAKGVITAYDKPGMTYITVKTSSGKKKKCIVRVR